MLAICAFLVSLASSFPLSEQPDEIPLFTDLTESRLISTSRTHQQWMTEAEIFKLYQKRIKFIDITDQDLEQLDLVFTTATFPTSASRKSIVEPMLKLADPELMTTFLTSFSQFQTRYYKSKSGQKAALWLFEALKALGKDTERFSVETFKHEWGQPSIIARIEGDGTAKDIVILSAHIDSVNQWNPWFGRAPGADDDGSGIFGTNSWFHSTNL
jgi:bacterial leucyl aminopeptidase